MTVTRKKTLCHIQNILTALNKAATTKIHSPYLHIWPHSGVNVCARGSLRCSDRGVVPPKRSECEAGLSIDLSFVYKLARKDSGKCSVRTISSQSQKTASNLFIAGCEQRTRERQNEGVILTIVNVTFKLLYFPYQIVGASVVRGNNSNLKRFIQLVVNVCEDWGGGVLLLLLVFCIFFFFYDGCL